MNKKMTILLYTALTAFITQFMPIYLLSSQMNAYLINTVRFVLLTTVIFLVFEKRILVNFKTVLKDGLILGFLGGIAVILSTIGIGLSNPISGLFFFMLPLSVFKKDKAGLFKSALFVIPALILIIVSDYRSPLGLLLLLVSSVFEYSALFYYSRYFSNRHLIKETLFTATLVPALLSTVMFFITKPASAAVLSDMQKFSLLILVIPASFIPALILSADRRITAGADMSFILLFAGIAGAVMNYPYLNVFSIIGILLLSLSGLTGSLKRKGSGRVELIAIVTLAAIVLSLIMPFKDSVRMRVSIYRDNQDFKNGKGVSEAVSIGNIYIKYINEEPAYIYQTGPSQFISVPIR